MKKAYKKLKKYLEKAKIPHGEIEHDLAGSVEQYNKVLGVDYEQQIKSILLKYEVRNKEALAVVVVQANKQVDLEQMRILLDAKEIRLATDKELEDETDCKSGELHPFGSIFKAKTLMDQDLLKQEKVYFKAGLGDVSMTVAPERLKDSEDPIMFTEINVMDSGEEQKSQEEEQTSIKEEPEETEKMRHSAAHVLAHAVLKLHPDAKIGIGPAIDNGFYYDFEFVEPISEDDLEDIEKEMKKIIKKDLPISQELKSRADAKKFYTNWEQDYKLDLLEGINDKKISFFITGDNDFIDMCRGPHVESTGKIGVVKLMRIAGAYWRGDENNPMLTRIYGVAFNSQEELDNYLAMQEEAERRNHRKIGKEMELFAVFPEVGQGLPVWLPNGYTMRRTLEDYMLKMERRYGYVHALSPHINKSELFEISGHLDFYKESMYAPIKIDDEEYYLKPMNCPASMLIYKMKPRSYRDLPMKLGELGTVYRYEKSGELHGLQRVRGFTQNDAHIFCTPEQLEEQFMEVFEMLQQFYKDLGFENYKYYLATSDPKAEKYKFCGTREAWEESENKLRQVLVRNGVEFKEEVGEAAFYGPKLDVKAVNVFGKEDAISTIQIDFNLAERFDISYVDSDGQKKRPYVIHRALIGSFERFFAFLIEYYAGQFPLWLAPQQVRIVPISEKHVEYSRQLQEKFMNMDIRSSLDDRDDTLEAKIRAAELEKINYILVVGDRELEASAVSVRPQGQKNIGMIEVSKFTEMLVKEIDSKGSYKVGDPLGENQVSNKDVTKS